MKRRVKGRDKQAELIAALEAFPGPDAGDLKVLDGVITEAVAQPADPALDRALFGIFERFPDEDGAGVYWGIVHGLEARGGYESALVESVRRSPSPLALTMLNRMSNDGETKCAGISIVTLLREVAASPSVPESIRKEASRYLEGDSS